MSPRNPSLWTSLTSVPFLLCVTVLAVAALGRATLVQRLRWVTKKEPIPLRKPLGSLDKERLGDYRFIRANKLSAAVEDSLGTDQYIDWILVDRSVGLKTDPRRHVRLSVTYYTGGPNLAPHTPDVCLKASGYEPKQGHEDRAISVSTLGEASREVPVRVCTFLKTAIFDNDDPTVIYTFHANGGFTSSSTGVRRRTHNIGDRYAYFSKVEVSFGSPRCQPRNLGREESIEAAAKLFSTVLPILVDEHWPEWDSVGHPDKSERS